MDPLRQGLHARPEEALMLPWRVIHVPLHRVVLPESTLGNPRDYGLPQNPTDRDSAPSGPETGVLIKRISGYHVVIFLVFEVWGWITPRAPAAVLVKSGLRCQKVIEALLVVIALVSASTSPPAGDSPPSVHPLKTEGRRLRCS